MKAWLDIKSIAQVDAICFLRTRLFHVLGSSYKDCQETDWIYKQCEKKWAISPVMSSVLRLCVMSIFPLFFIVSPKSLSSVTEHDRTPSSSETRPAGDFILKKCTCNFIQRKFCEMKLCEFWIILQIYHVKEENCIIDENLSSKCFLNQQFAKVYFAKKLFF